MSNQGWIGVDLDGTLAFYNGWVNEHHIGEPVPAMVQRVKQWLEEGREVRIFTARVAVVEGNRSQSTADAITETIQAWCRHHLGQTLDVTCSKDFGMIELWDDRCVQIICNTGRRADGN
jgi:hypothetical protein